MGKINAMDYVDKLINRFRIELEKNDRTFFYV